MSRERGVLTSIVVAAAAAAGLVAFDAHDRDSQRRVGGEFQSLTRGLGFGSHLDLSRRPWLFDPRVADDWFSPPAGAPDDPSGCEWHSLSLFPPPSAPESLE